MRRKAWPTQIPPSGECLRIKRCRWKNGWRFHQCDACLTGWQEWMKRCSANVCFPIFKRHCCVIESFLCLSTGSTFVLLCGDTSSVTATDEWVSCLTRSSWSGGHMDKDRPWRDSDLIHCVPEPFSTLPQWSEFCQAYPHHWWRIIEGRRLSVHAKSTSLLLAWSNFRLISMKEGVYRSLEGKDKQRWVKLRVRHIPKLLCTWIAWVASLINTNRDIHSDT
jgi:hypothetical protein